MKTVNGTAIYIRDVAFVHEGSPAQTNVVPVDGVCVVDAKGTIVKETKNR